MAVNSNQIQVKKKKGANVWSHPTTVICSKCSGGWWKTNWNV